MGLVKDQINYEQNDTVYELKVNFEELRTLRSALQRYDNWIGAMLDRGTNDPAVEEEEAIAVWLRAKLERMLREVK